MHKEARDIIASGQAAIGASENTKGLHLISALTDGVARLNSAQRMFEAALIVLVRHELVLEWAHEYGKLTVRDKSVAT